MELLGGGSLQISNLTEEDAGVYTCVADNANGTVEAQAQLTVQGTGGGRSFQLQEEKQASLLAQPLALLWVLNAVVDVEGCSVVTQTHLMQD